MIRQRLLSLSLLCLIAAPLAAATYIVPTDRVLAARAGAIVVATAGDSYTQLTSEGGIETVTRFAVEEVMKGDAGMTALEVHEPGGFFGGRGLLIPGVPRFTAGERVILFVSRTPQQTWAVTDLALGRFTIEHGLATRADVEGWDAGGTRHSEQPRSADGFLAFLRGRGGDDYVVPRSSESVILKPASNAFTASSYTSDLSGGRGGRWNVFPSAVTFHSVNSEPGAPGNGVNAIQSALAAWSGAGGSNVNYVYGGGGGGTGGLTMSDGINTIAYEQDLSSVGAAFSCGSGGLLGIGGMWTSGTSTFNGETFFTAVEGDVQMNKGIANCTSLFTSGDFDTAVTHETGHTLGFRHSDQTRANDPNTPCSTDPSLECSSAAVMKAVIELGIRGALQPWDVHAAGSVYGTGAPCTPPSITSQPQNVTINAGQQTTLSVTASGTAPLTFQWYIGTSGNTSTPIQGATQAQVIVSPSSTTTYWVQVNGACAPAANSTTVTVTVNPGPCPNVTVGMPTATSQGGSTFALNVAASGGTSFTFQWFQGATSGSGTPVGTGNPFFVSPAVTTTYWVRVTNNCGNSADSATVTVNVNTTCPTVSVTTPTATPQSGGGFLLGTTASGGTSFTFQWFQSNGVMAGSGNPLFVNPTGTAGYFVHVTNQCGNQTDSAVITVTPTNTCIAPAITSATATPSSITDGASVTLTATATGTNVSFQWFHGNVGDMSNPVTGGNAATVVVTPSVTSSYWVQVTSGCGAPAANGGFVVVQVSCAPVTFTLPPAITISSGASATITLTVAGSQPIHVTWYRGQPVDTLHQVGTDSPVLNTGPLTTTTTFWAHLQNDCFAVNTQAIVVNVKAVKHRAAHH